MSVEVTLTGRLGNNLFQYTIGRIIAEHHGFELNCSRAFSPEVTFMGKVIDIGPPALLEGLTAYFPNAPLHLPGKRVSAPMDSFELGVRGAWDGSTMDLAGVLADRSQRQIRLKGYFQRYEYFESFQKQIRYWLDFKPIASPHTINIQ